MNPAGSAAGDPAPVPAAHAEHRKSSCKTGSREVFLQHRHTVPPVSTADKLSASLRVLFISFHWVFPILFPVKLQNVLFPYKSEMGLPINCPMAITFQLAKCESKH